MEVERGGSQHKRCRRDIIGERGTRRGSITGVARRFQKKIRVAVQGKPSKNMGTVREGGTCLGEKGKPEIEHGLLN